MSLNLRIVLPVVLMLLVVVGCGKKTAPPPPMTNSRLVLQIFAALKDKSHETAYNQICRLSAIEKNDVFLGALKNSELANLYIEKAQLQVDKMQLSTARENLDKALLTYGRNKTFLDAQTAIDSLLKIQELAPLVEYPRSGAQLEKDAGEMVVLLEKLPGAGPYLAMVKEKIELARSMQLIENERAVFSLYTELIRLRQVGEGRMADVLTAELGFVAPPADQLGLADQLQADVVEEASSR